MTPEQVHQKLAQLADLLERLRDLPTTDLAAFRSDGPAR
jgi:hypothetical protein